MDPLTRMFVDSSGRSTIFHGVNIVVKQPPYLPNTQSFDPQMSLVASDIENLVNWGFNFVRLGVMWESVETSPGVYNYSYLSNITTIIRMLGESGIYTLIDAHQDAYARHICGEGIPDFYAANLTDKCDGIFGSFLESIGSCVPFSSYKYPVDQNGDPLITSCLNVSFVEYFKTPEAADGYQRIYENKHGMRDKFLAFWDVISQEFAGNPYVVGYDMLNEPLQANMVTQPWVKIPGVNDYVNLQPLYKLLNNTIRKNDDEKILFFEPIQADLLPYLGGMVFPIGLTETPGGEDYNDRQVLNDHSYCCQAGKDVCLTGEPSIGYKEFCNKVNYNRVTSRAIDAQNLGVGLMITEFGACLDSQNCVNEITAVTEACDQNLAGWAYWMFKGFGDFTTTGSLQQGFYNNQTLQVGKVKALARTYVQYYQGVPQSISFNSETGSFHTSFLVNSEITEPTVLFFSTEFYYQSTPQIIITTNNSAATWTNTTTHNYFSLLFNSVSSPTLAEITIPATNLNTSL